MKNKWSKGDIVLLIFAITIFVLLVGMKWWTYALFGNTPIKDLPAWLVM